MYKILCFELGSRMKHVKIDFYFVKEGVLWWHYVCYVPTKD